MSELATFLNELSITEPAIRITLTDSRDDLSVKLHTLAVELRRHATFPTTLKPSRISTLLEKVASRSPDLDVWSAVAELLKAPVSTVSGAPSVAAVKVNATVAQYLKK